MQGKLLTNVVFTNLLSLSLLVPLGPYTSLLMSNTVAVGGSAKLPDTRLRMAIGATQELHDHYPNWKWARRYGNESVFGDDVEIASVL